MDDILRDLAAFAAVARTLNFRRAAVEQQVSVSSLSQRLRSMEERLGVRLLNRTTRSVALTEAGAMLLERIGPAMRDVTAALNQVRGLRDVPSGHLRINAPSPVADLVLGPMVAPFLKQFPQIELQIVVESSLIDIVEKGFDAGVRYGERLAQDMIAVPLGGRQRYAVVASPDFVASHGRPEQPRDLLNFPCIRTRFDSGVMLDWEFEKDGRIVKVSPRGPLIANYSRLQLRSVLDGLGYHLTLTVMCATPANQARSLACWRTGAPPFLGRFCTIRAVGSRRPRSPPFSRSWLIGEKMREGGSGPATIRRLDNGQHLLP